MDDRARVLAATLLGAVAGGILGGLYLTERGRVMRAQVEPFFESLIGELQMVQRTVDKAREAAAEGRRVMTDALRPPA